MKRSLVLILTLLYTVTSTGATFHLHYCMGKLVDVEFLELDPAKCSKCGPEGNSTCTKKCCKDIHQTVKLEKDHKVSEYAFQFLQPAAVPTPVSFTGLPAAFPVSLVEEYPAGNAPPRSGNVPSRIFFCTFRI